MVTLINESMRYTSGRLVPSQQGNRGGSMAMRILEEHNIARDGAGMRIRFDAMASHDITYVGIIQTARASGMKEFPLPYVLTNCHNSLCAVGGTINEDDHQFGLSAAKKYGGIYVPAHQAVIHQYMRECWAGCGKMILGSDSHTRYGALGCMGVGEGGPELVKQLLKKTYDIARPQVVAVHLTGAPRRGVGPQDVALAIIKAVFGCGFVKNKVMEFMGPGVEGLSVEYRGGIDVMTTETTCLSSIWTTDEKVRDYLKLHGREGDYQPLAPEEGALYDGAVMVELDKVEPMIALPFHPSNAYTIREFIQNAPELLKKVEDTASGMVSKGKLPDLKAKIKPDGVYIEQGVIAGCSGGTYENLMTAADILEDASIGDDVFSLSLYPASQPQYLALIQSGAAARLMKTGATLRSAFCGPCFGAGDVPSNGALSIRHTTRNFPSREGSKPGEGQISYVALMDARSIAATARNGGKLTPADEVDWVDGDHSYSFDASVYANRVYNGWGKAQQDLPLVFGPNIADWPEMIRLPENLVLEVASSILDPVTTTDELIPSGETSSYRSNPLRLAEFALSRKDPGYVGRAKAVQRMENSRRAFLSGGSLDQEAREMLSLTGKEAEQAARDTGLGSLVFALKPGDGSAREQAASCQRVLGGCANVAAEYATKRYRSNVVNWGMLPFIMKDAAASPLQVGDKLLLMGIKRALEQGDEHICATLIRNGERREIALELPAITKDERDILLAGCLINYYAE